jgi:magnesium-transporting ATPase (P-type)
MNGTLLGDPLDIACLKFTSWKYDAGNKCATDKEAKVWQIRTFPFDSQYKMSSAIVLTYHKETYRLLVVAKGSTSKMSTLFADAPMQWYSSEVNRLGGMGYRTISLGVLDASETEIARRLFPSGLPQKDTFSDALVHEARNNAREIHRNEVEKSFSPVGIASFDAPVRASTSRVISELRHAKIELKMLTGDDHTTSLTVAKKAGMMDALEAQNSYLLKLNEDGLVLEMNKKKMDLTVSTAKKVQNEVADRSGVLAVQGDAVQAIIKCHRKDKKMKLVRDVLLPHAMLITNASPNDKHLIVNWLQHRGKHVLMCGM